MDVAGRGDVPEQTWRAMIEYMKRVNPTLWQLFGSMSDDQIDRFLETRRASLPVRSLTPTQRVALDAVLDANKDNETEISGVVLRDFRTLLYKMGARRDLSNVTIGFTIEGANTLSFSARVAGNNDPLQWTGWAQAPRLGPRGPAPTRAREAAHSQSQRPLPDWAPKNPSPEFLRAAKVLKPFPLGEMLRTPEGNDPSTRAAANYAVRVWSAAYEFFGTLSDGQVRDFLSRRRILIPVKALTVKQRTALDEYFEASRQAGKDRTVELYRGGAKSDLSNVEAGFAMEGRTVYISCGVRSDRGYYSFIDTIATM